MSQQGNLNEYRAANAQMRTAIWTRTAVEFERKFETAKIVLQLRERFESDQMHRLRKLLATQIGSDDKVTYRAERVLMLLDSLAALTRCKVLVPEIVLREFSWEITHYWEAMKHFGDKIAALRSCANDATLYSDLEWLYDQCVPDRGGRLTKLVENELMAFLDDEKSLA